MHITKILTAPLLTEKNQLRIGAGVYTFRVPIGVTKPQIKVAVETIFSVKTRKIAIMKVPPRQKRVGRYTGTTATYKKAIIYLIPGQRLSFLHPEEDGVTGAKTKKKKKAAVNEPVQT